jgi:poly(3-hydroxybutyrate) depolymerase
LAYQFFQANIFPAFPSLPRHERCCASFFHPASLLPILPCPVRFFSMIFNSQIMKKNFINAIAFLFLLITAACLMSSCCGRPQQRYEWTEEINGENRKAIIWKSNNKCKKSNVVIYMHGRGGDAEDSEERRKFHELWPAAYIVYAEGTNFDNQADGKRGWQVRFPHMITSCNKTKDIVYIEKLLTHLKADDKVNPDKIFICGHSSGGFFTLSLTQLMPDKFKAFAALGCYSSFIPVFFDCENSYNDGIQNSALQNLLVATNPAPVLYMFGKKENTVKPNNLAYNANCGTFSYCQNTILQLCQKNNSTPPPCPGSDYMNTLARQIFAAAGSNGAETQFQLYEGDHSWPTDANGWTIDYFKAFN